MTQPLVSIIMNCYNGERYLKEAFDSVLAQSYPNWEAILWDNQSKDQSAVITKEYAAQDERVKYHYADEFTPLGEARNRAIKVSSGEIIAFLDVDDIWYPEKLELQVQEFLKDPEVGIVYNDTIFFDSEGDRKQLYAEEEPYIGDIFRSLLKRYNFSMETIAIRKSHLEQLDQWFDPRFNMIEEADLFIRLSKFSRASFINKVLSKWRMHSASWTFSKYELFPKEKRQMLEKFEQMYPNFRQEYAEECLEIEKGIATEMAIVNFQKKDAQGVRAAVRPYLAQKKFMLLNLLSYFPQFVINFVLKMKGLTPK